MKKASGILMGLVTFFMLSSNANAYKREGRANISSGGPSGVVINCYADNVICWTDDNGNSQIPPPAGTKIKVLVDVNSYTWEEYTIASYLNPSPNSDISVTGGRPTTPPVNP